LRFTDARVPEAFCTKQETAYFHQQVDDPEPHSLEFRGGAFLRAQKTQGQF